MGTRTDDPTHQTPRSGVNATYNCFKTFRIQENKTIVYLNKWQVNKIYFLDLIRVRENTHSWAITIKCRSMFHTDTKVLRLSYELLLLQQTENYWWPTFAKKKKCHNSVSVKLQNIMSQLFKIPDTFQVPFVVCISYNNNSKGCPIDLLKLRYKTFITCTLKNQRWLYSLMLS